MLYTVLSSPLGLGCGGSSCHCHSLRLQFVILKQVLHRKNHKMAWSLKCYPSDIEVVRLQVAFHNDPLAFLVKQQPAINTLREREASFRNASSMKHDKT